MRPELRATRSLFRAKTSNDAISCCMR